MRRLQTPAQLGPNLRSLRKARGLTQSELGAMFGVSAMRISAIERNPENVGLAQLMRILSALGARLYLDSGSRSAVSERAASPGGEW